MKPVLKTAAIWTTLVVTTSLTSACTKEQPTPPPTTAAQPTTTPTPTPSPTVAPDVAEAQEAAKQVAIRYHKVLSSIGMDALSVTNADIDAVSTGMESTRLIETRSQTIATGQKATGPSRTVRAIAGETKLENDPAGQPPKIPTVTITLCWDYTGISVIDKTGKSVLDPSHPTTGTSELMIANYKYPDKNQWRVYALASQQAGAACPEK